MSGYSKASKHRLLSRDEERTLGRKIVAGNQAAVQLNNAHIEGERLSYTDRKRLNDAVRDGKAAKDTLVTHNLRLAMNVAKGYAAKQQNRLTYEDLVQESTIGLMRAADKFDPEKEFKFSTYATWWCRQACQRATANVGRMIRLPMHIDANVRKLAAVIDQLDSVGATVSRSEIATMLGWDADKLNETWAYMDASRVDYLDNPMGDESGLSYIDTVVDPAEDVGVDGIRASFAEDILKALSVLPPREHEVLCWRYGLKNTEPLNLQEIGDRMSLTRERVRQLEAKAIARLRHPSSGVAWAFAMHLDNLS